MPPLPSKGEILILIKHYEGEAIRFNAEMHREQDEGGRQYATDMYNECRRLILAWKAELDK